MKTTYLRMPVSGALILLCLWAKVFAQDEGTRLNFKRGTSSATVTGTVAKGGPDFYLVGAQAGQTMTVKVTGKVSFGIEAAGEPLTADDSNKTWNKSLPADGDYKIKVFSGGGAQAYTLMVAIAAAAAMPAPQSFTTSGFFNGIHLTSQESGDYGGTSVFLTESDGQLFALVTIAEGVSLPPVLVKAKVSGKDMRTIEFTLPNENGDRKFKGRVAAKSMMLESDGAKEVLKRGCGFLASNISLGSGGDYGGTEVFLTDADGQWYALVTVAEGILKSPVLVKAKLTPGKANGADSVEFTLPRDSGGQKFTGKLTRAGLTLTESGTPTTLKSKCYK